MAKRLRFQKLIRKIHLYTSIFMLVFMLFYSFTGFVMSRHEWFPHGPAEIIEQNYKLQFKPDTSQIQPLANKIANEYQLNGRFSYSYDWQHRLEFIYNRPGHVSTVKFNQELDTVNIKHEIKATFGEINTRLHRIHGFSGGLLYYFWAILLDLAGISAIVFAITGIIMWYRLRKKFWYGWFFLVPPILIVILYFYYLY